MSKIDGLRDTLEENCYSLSNSTHLRQLVPLIFDNEMSTLQQEIHGQTVSFIFDGTTPVAEASVVLLRFVDSAWCIEQRVAKLILLAKSLSGEEVERLLIETLSTTLGISSTLVIAAIRDTLDTINYPPGVSDAVLDDSPDL